MKRQKIIIVVSIFVLTLTTMLMVNNLYHEISDSTNNLRLIKKKTIAADIGKENWSQKKLKVRGVIRSDSPDKFDEMHSKIRTAPGKTHKEYPRNYRFTELAKAKSELMLMKNSNSEIMQKLNWVERGPANVGGRTRAILVDPDDTTYKTWFAGAVGGGIWKTTDAGASWNPISDYLPNLAVTCLNMAESNTQVMYAGTGEGFYNVDAIEGNGIMKTNDKGLTWTQLASTADDDDFAFVNRLVIDPTNENIVLAATNSGILKTVDGGVSWTKKYNGMVQDMRANSKNFNTLFASVSQGVMRSLDAGNTWSLPENAKFGEGSRIEIATALSDTNRVYASVDSTPNKIFATFDGGTNWVEIKEVDGSDKAWLGFQGWYDNTIGVNPYNENIVYVGGIDLWKSEISIDSIGVPTRTTIAISDGYNQYATNTYIHVDHHNITLFPTDPSNNEFIFLNGNDGGIAVSYNAGVSFEEVGDNGYNTSQFYGVDKKPGGSQYIGGLQDNGTWESEKNVNADKTTKYSYRIGGDGFEVSWHYTDPDKMIGGSQFNRFWKTENGWQSYFAADNGFNGWGNSDVSPFVSKIAKSYSNPDLLYTITTEGVYKSENFGTSWSLYPIPEFSNDGYFNVAQVAISIAEPQVVWAGAYTNNLFVSQDGGFSFSKVNDNSLVSSALISGLDTHPTDEATAYITLSLSGSAKVLRTTDYGQNWSDISGYNSNSTSSNGFPNVATYCVSVMPYNTDIIWVGSDIGIIESVDGGISWHLANNGLPQVAIWEIRVVDDEVVVATHGRGVWSVVLPELANHKPPVATLTPVLNSVNQGFNGIVLNTSLRSIYDSTHVVVDNKNVMKIMNNEVTDTTIVLQVTESGTVSIYLSAFKGAREYKSTIHNLDVYEFLAIKNGYVTDFSTSSEDFILNGLSISTPSGFSNEALHSSHPYPDEASYTAVLRVPIIVAETDANLVYDDIAIIESGELGTVYGDDEFWDYVIVEANNGGEWVPLQDGYDARFDAIWKSAYENDLNGNPSMYKSHNINLLDKFSAGDTLQIRFRLFADIYTNSWGWSIDNLTIQGQFVGINDSEIIPAKFEISQNYPNPFNPSTKISFSLPTESKVKLQIFNTLGEIITTLVDETNSAGVHEVNWNASNLASGVYLYRIDAESVSDAKNYTSTKKMLLLK